jgi:hypothetical protein
MPIWESMRIEAMKTMPSPTRRAEGLPAGAAVLPIVPWPLDPAHENPGRRLPMWVTPPPRRRLVQRALTALGQLGATVISGAGLLMLVSHLATPG